jgi:Domain of unknown function (DUF4352)
MVKFCSKCGAEAGEETSLYCALCGAQLAADIPDDNRPYGSSSNLVPAQEQGGPGRAEIRAVKPKNPSKTVEIQKNRVNTGVFIIVGVILFSLILLGILFPPKDNSFTIIFPPKDNSSGSSPILQTTTIAAQKLTPVPALNRTPTRAPTRTPTRTPTPVESLAPEILSVPLGEGASDGTTSVIVFSAKKTYQYSYYSETVKKIQNETAPPGKMFVIVDAGIKNIGAQVLNASSSSFSLTDSNGYKYDPSHYGNDELTLQQLYLNQTSIGKILFIIPKTTTGLRLHYNFGDFATGPKLVAWPIK